MHTCTGIDFWLNRTGEIPTHPDFDYQIIVSRAIKDLGFYYVLASVALIHQEHDQFAYFDLYVFG